MSRTKHKPAIPDEALRQHIAVVGRTGSGKTYTAKGLVERLLAAGQRVCVLDPTGAWWGLRTDADERRPGFPVTIFGGDHGDVPINEHAGEAVARLVAGGNIPAVIDLSDTYLSERRRFGERFFEVLFKANRSPLHLVIDEADEFFPQNASDDGMRRLQGAVDRIIRRGRIKGFRVMMITQRLAVLHKNALTQAGTLVAMRLPAPQDRKAVEDWIKGQADTDVGKEVLGSLSKLKMGEGWVWSPEHGVLERLQFPAIRTYDSSRTPEDEEVGAEPPRTIAEVDISGIEKALQEAIEEAERNDPAKLRRRVEQLKRELLAAQRAPVATPGDIDAIVARAKAEAAEGYQGLLVETERSAAALLQELRGSVARAETIGAELRSLFVLMSGARSAGACESAGAFRESLAGSPKASGRPGGAEGSGATASAEPADPAEREGLKGPQRRIVDALAWWASVGVEAPSRAQVGFVAGIKPSGGHFNNTIGPLVTRGMVSYPANGFVSLEGPGWAVAAPPSRPPTLADYQAEVLGMLRTGPQRKVAEALIDAGRGATLSRAELGERAGIKPSGGHFNNTIGPLRTMGLLEYPEKGFVRATDLLWPAGL